MATCMGDCDPCCSGWWDDGVVLLTNLQLCPASRVQAKLDKSSLYFYLTKNDTMKATVLAPVAALCIGGAAGFFAGQNNAPAPDSDTPADTRSARRTALGSGSSSSSEGVRANRVRSAKEAMALPGQNNRLTALMNYYSGLDPSEFEDEAKKLEELPWSERMMVGYLLFARWGEEDPTAAMAYTKTMGFGGNFVRGTVMQSWAAKYPQDAATYYAQNTNEFRAGGFGGRGGRGGAATASVIATEWARQDSAGAMKWAQSLEGRDQREAISGIVTEAAKEDPAAAAAMLSSISDEDSKKDAQNSIAREWGKQDWGGAKAWIAGLPTDQQEDATARALRGLADSDPEAAAANLTSLAEGDARDNAAESIAREWSREDPAAAANWLMESGSANAQEDGIGRVVSTWVGQDSAAALQFVNAQPEGDIRDEAASSFVMANQSGDVQENLKLAETIGGERDRSRAIAVTAANWARDDREAAQSYIQSTDALSDEAKERITRFSEGGGVRGRRGGRGR